MSLSVNNPSFVKVDASAFDRSAGSSSMSSESANAHAPGASVSNTPLRIDNSRFSPNEVMIPGAALAKLFDMLEQIFKTIREMVAGKDLMPAALPDLGKSPEGTPQERNLPANAEAGKPLRDLGNKLPAKPDAGKQANLPGAGRLLGESDPVKPLDMQDLSKLLGKPEAGKPVNLQGADGLQVKTDAGKQLEFPDAGKLPTTRDVPQPPVKPQLSELPVVNHDVRQKSLAVSYPTTTKPDGTVTSDAKANINVHVNVNCHCPDTRVSPQGGLKPRLATDFVSIPDALAQPDAKIDVTPKAEDKAKADHHHEVTQTVKRLVERELQPGETPKAKDEAKADHHHEVTQTVKRLVERELQPGETPKAEDEAKADHHHEVTQTIKREVKQDLQPGAPRPVPEPPVLPLTSPGPAEDYFEQGDWRFNTPSVFRP
ncbi:hypothetical protein ACMSI6_15840 [Pseudomonas antarctica]|uniref:hypothetical protein n=1 Tax=Pseudomonas antarctica TaxID=219572 RepID=UPI0039C07BE7